MKELLRRNEIPKEFNRQRLAEMYPGATIVGDPYGFFYYVEATNTVFINYGWKDLVKRVTEHLQGNGIEIPINLGLIMQETFCQHRPDFCAERDPDAERKITAWQMMKRFYKGAVEPFLQNRLVGQEEAERRAAICASCPFNTDKITEFCVSCATRSLVSNINQFLTTRHTSKDGELKFCGVCQCDLKMKAWAPKDSMDEPELRERWPEHCWMR